MKTEERNRMYWLILDKFNFDLEKEIKQLNSLEIKFLVKLAEAMYCKSENGKSPAKTLLDRAKQGRPF